MMVSLKRIGLRANGTSIGRIARNSCISGVLKYNSLKSNSTVFHLPAYAYVEGSVVDFLNKSKQLLLCIKDIRYLSGSEY